jgi:hypothetical protein
MNQQQTQNLLKRLESLSGYSSLQNAKPLRCPVAKITIVQAGRVMGESGTDWNSLIQQKTDLYRLPLCV